METKVTSFSAIEAWNRCPKNYQYSYEVGIRPVSATGGYGAGDARSLGRLGHKLIELSVLGNQPEFTDLTVKAATEMSSGAIKILSLVNHFISEDKIYNYIKGCLTEKKYGGRLTNEVLLCGTVDAVSPEDGTMFDYKFSSRVYDNGYLGTSLQMPLYAALMERHYNREFNKGHYIFFRKTVTDPSKAISRIEKPISDGAKKYAVREAERVTDITLSTTERPVQTGYHCSFCDFAPLCAAKINDDKETYTNLIHGSYTTAKDPDDDYGYSEEELGSIVDMRL